MADIEESLAVNDAGELVYTKSELQTEVLKPEHAIRRWPVAEKQTLKALDTLDWRSAVVSETPSAKRI